ncbi:glycine zipper 2TM domain-containing protein [Corticibacter populi]|uniref:Glycine zipper 2TM domain-containing protein n=1 Tax=Corticibacter populi TaxID=1550736 RepID=A0A3M6QXG1_9BURK|nr:glycine zipper 2TM domain-containing protein [Corticibacter populi]RMX07688.1 glycine zipper 2TM domain-containing protein [Corticibacter populi]RZS30199.1 outer membrane lipoprotein SlyB [Corticibacter populi]
MAITLRTACMTTAIAASLALVGCQTTQPYYQQQGSAAVAPAPANTLEYGYVTQIDTLQNTHRGSTGAGILLGAVVGGLLGNQVGGGTGRTAATIAGTVGGAVAGNTIEGRMDSAQQGPYGYRVTIQVDNGAYRLYDVTSPGDLRVGDRVQVRDGQIARTR